MKRMSEVVDGEYQKYTVESGEYIRKHFFGADPQLLEMVEHLSDEQIQKMRRGGHDPEKVYAAYKAAMEHKGSPTVILAKTIKGYGLGEAGEGKNITHQQKKLNEEELREFRSRFGIPISDDDIAKAPFYRPPDDSPEMQYLQRTAQGTGWPPAGTHGRQRSPLKTPRGRRVRGISRRAPANAKSPRRWSSCAFWPSCCAIRRSASSSCRSCPTKRAPSAWKRCSARCGIYSHAGQLYEPVDKDSLLYYKEAKDGQILEEGITEAGSMSSFIAAGTAYATSRHQHDPVLYLLFDVRIPADRRLDLGRRRYAVHAAS